MDSGLGFFQVIKWGLCQADGVNKLLTTIFSLLNSTE